MKTSILLSVIIGLSVSPLARATSVNFGAVPSARSVFQNDGTTVTPAGSLIMIGTFGNESFSMSGGNILANVAAIQTAGAWIQFVGTSSTLTLNNVSSNSKVGGTVTNNTAAADPFNGKQIYLWIFDAPTVGAATQMGIFEATSATVPWLFPTNLGGVGDGVLLSTTSIGATIAAVGTVPVGSATSSQLLLAAPVPEPSAAFLSAVGFVAMASGRRRQRK